LVIVQNNKKIYTFFIVTTLFSTGIQILAHFEITLLCMFISSVLNSSHDFCAISFSLLSHPLSMTLGSAFLFCLPRFLSSSMPMRTMPCLHTAQISLATPGLC